MWRPTFFARSAVVWGLRRVTGGTLLGTHQGAAGGAAPAGEPPMLHVPLWFGACGGRQGAHCSARTKARLAEVGPQVHRGGFHSLLGCAAIWVMRFGRGEGGGGSPKQAHSIEVQHTKQLPHPQLHMLG